jgi:hypothetical protein
MTRFGISLILIFVFAVLPVTAQETDYSKIDPAIEHVWSGGFWQQGERDGNYRFIVAGVGADHRWNYLFIQWMSFDFDKMESKVVASVRVKELENAAGYIFDVPDCKSTTDCKRLTMDVTHTRTYEKSHVEITLTGVGKYTITGP